MYEQYYKYFVHYYNIINNRILLEIFCHSMVCINIYIILLSYLDKYILY